MKKQRKTKGRGRRHTKRSRSDAGSARKSTKPVFVLILVSCLLAAGIWGGKTLLQQDDSVQQDEPPEIVDRPVEESTAEPGDEQQEDIASLKEEAVQLAERLIGEFPESEVPFVIMGNIHRYYGNHPEAVKYWERALEKNPRRTDVYDGLGWIAIKNGQSEEGIGFWRKALAIDPAMAGVHNEIAQALLTLGKYSEVVEEAQEELKIRPRSYLAHYLCGQGYLKQKEYEKAKECYETALENQPDSRNAHYGLVTACSRMCLKDDAARYMDRFKELKEKDNAERTEEFREYGDLAEAKKKLAEICGDAEKLYRNKADSQMSRRLLERAVVLDPENAQHLRGLAYVYQMAQQLPEALQLYEKATLAEPDNSMNYMNIGNISVQLRQYANAERALRKVTEVAPNMSIG